MRSRSRLARTACALAVWAWALSGGFAQEPIDALATIDSLNCDIKRGKIRVDYSLVGALGAEARRSLEGGLTVMFVHELVLVRRRAFWFPKEIARRRVELTASFDPLTRQYTLVRSVDGGEEVLTGTDRQPEVDLWLTHVAEVFDGVDEPDSGTIVVKVKSIYEHGSLLFLVPWPLSANGEAECR